MADLTVAGGPPLNGEPQTFTVTDFAKAVLDDANAGAVRTTIGAGTSSFSGSYPDLTNKPVNIYLKDSNDHYYRLGVTILGILTTTDMGTDLPTDGVIGVG